MAVSPDKTQYYQPGSPGLGSAASYQVSGYPYVTGAVSQADSTEVQVTFPTVTKSITVRTTADVAVKVAFREATAGGVFGGQHYLTVQGMSAMALAQLTLPVKCSEIFITNDSGGPASWQVYAELTGISRSEMFELTGSGITALNT